MASWNYDEMTAGTNKECVFSDYLLLSMRYGDFGNIQIEMTVDTDYFSTTSSGRRPQFTHPKSELNLSVYQVGNNIVRAHGSNVGGNDNLNIYGIIKKN